MKMNPFVHRIHMAMHHWLRDAHNLGAWSLR